MFVLAAVVDRESICAERVIHFWQFSEREQGLRSALELKEEIRAQRKEEGRRLGNFRCAAHAGARSGSRPDL